LALTAGLPARAFQAHEMSGMAMTAMASGLFGSLPMARDGSGTSWLPDASPVYALGFSAGRWAGMVHGGAYFRYTDQDAGQNGSRGGRRFDGPNWLMAMASRGVGSRSRFMLRAMLSFDRITEGGAGYPLLFQTGETWKGKALVDRQHPHDLFSELAAAWSFSLTNRSGVFLYFGLPGEPALGPSAFMHRPSASDIPDAPLGHHWQDSTHISFGVVTAGWWRGDFKLDGSVFNGREPDENRFNIDRPRFDSWSLRLTYNPIRNASLQVSHGFLRSPEALEPETDVRRTTASLLMEFPLPREKHVSTALILGLNKPDTGAAQFSFLAEAKAILRRLSLYTRFEVVRKRALDLQIKDLGERLFRIRGWTLGISRDILTSGPLRFCLGAQAILFFVPSDLRRMYGRAPYSLEAYFRLGLARVRAGGTSMPGDIP
jgi:hypothetical protein